MFDEFASSGARFGDHVQAWVARSTTSDPGSAVPSGGQPGGGKNPLRTPAEKDFVRQNGYGAPVAVEVERAMMR